MDDKSGRRRYDTGSRPYHHGALRDALIETAMALLETTSPEKLSLRGAARAAGVSQAAPYRHFDSKQALLAEVAYEGYRRLREVLIDGLRADQDPDRGFLGMGVAYVRFALSHPGLFRLMIQMSHTQAGRYPHLAEAVESTRGILWEAARRHPRKDDVYDPYLYGLAAWSRVHGLAGLIIDKQVNIPADRPLDEFLRDVLTGGRKD